MEETPKGGRGPPWAVVLLEKDMEEQEHQIDYYVQYSVVVICYSDVMISPDEVDIVNHLGGG
jgi:hypothetical protein